MPLVPKASNLIATALVLDLTKILANRFSKTENPLKQISQLPQIIRIFRFNSYKF